MNKPRRKFLNQLTFITGAAALSKPLESAASVTKHTDRSTNTNPGCPVVHFEIGCANTEKTNAFYTSIFGWTGTVSPAASMLNTNSDKGVQGHITALGHEPAHYVTVYIEVDDIPAYLSKITAAGGKKIVGPIKLPDGKQFAWFMDPDSNVIGLLTK
jgi:uncharacterized protein